MVRAKPKARSLLLNRSADCTKYWYDAVGQRVRMREPDGGRFTYWYDGVGQINRLLNPFQENTTFTYDAVGRRTMQKLANLVRASYNYDALNRVTTLANVRADGTYVSRYDYAYDNTMNKTRVQEADGNRVTWTYDRTYQLTSERRSGANAYDITYTYDSASNRRLKIATGTRTTYTCNVANQLGRLQDNSGRTTFTYDANGNQTLQLVPALTRTTYVWDGDDRLLLEQASNGSHKTYTFSSLNMMSSQASVPGQTNYTWDRRSLLQKKTGSAVTYFTTRDKPLLISQYGSSSSYYHLDGQDSVRSLTNALTQISDEYAYTSFGIPVLVTGSTDRLFTFLGSRQYLNNDTDTYFNRTIYYASHFALQLNPSIFIPITMLGDIGVRIRGMLCSAELASVKASCGKQLNENEWSFLEQWLQTECNSRYPSNWWKGLVKCVCNLRVYRVALYDCMSICIPTGWERDSFASMAVYHKGACWCMRKPRPAVIDKETGRSVVHQQQCCYDRYGALITEPDWGGTADYDGDNHIQEDVYPYHLLQRCGRLDIYFKYRPIDNRSNCKPNKGSPTHTCDTEKWRCGAFGCSLTQYGVKCWGWFYDRFHANPPVFEY